MLNEYENVVAPTMERLRHKMQLVKDLNEILCDLSRYEKLYKKKYNKFLKSILKDGLDGFKAINSKNKVFIEMPKLEKVANGQVKKVYDKALVNQPEDNEILVNLPNNKYIDKS